MAQYLPLLFLLACPLMMVFMMRGMHGGHDTPSPVHPHDAVDPLPTDAATSARVAELERQVAELHEQLAKRPSSANQN